MFVCLFGFGAKSIKILCVIIVYLFIYYNRPMLKHFVRTFIFVWLDIYHLFNTVFESFICFLSQKSCICCCCYSVLLPLSFLLRRYCKSGVQFIDSTMNLIPITTNAILYNGQNEPMLNVVDSLCFNIIHEWMRSSSRQLFLFHPLHFIVFLHVLWTRWWRSVHDFLRNIWCCCCYCVFCLLFSLFWGKSYPTWMI